MEGKPKLIKVQYTAEGICREVDDALIKGLDVAGYDCGDVGSFLGGKTIDREMEFTLKGLAEYPFEDVEPPDGQVWLSCTLEDYEAREILNMLDMSLKALKGTKWEEDAMPMVFELKRKLRAGMTGLKDEDG